MNIFIQIDCLGRSFFFDEAQQLIKQFEHDHPPYLPMYSEFTDEHIACILNLQNEQVSVFDREL
jgi:hypothetical protein